MKKNILALRIFMCGCAALGWWGFFYPELTMTPDTYRIVMEDGTVQSAAEMVKWDFDSDIYHKILSADSSQIRFRSKLVEKVADFIGVD